MHYYMICEILEEQFKKYFHPTYAIKLSRESREKAIKPKKLLINYLL